MLRWLGVGIGLFYGAELGCWGFLRGLSLHCHSLYLYPCLYFDNKLRGILAASASLSALSQLG